MNLTIEDWAFNSAIYARPHDQHPALTNLFTYLRRENVPAVRVFRNIDREYTAIVEAAAKQINPLLDPSDFFISPIDWGITIVDDWQEQPLNISLLVDFVFPKEIIFIGGISLVKKEADASKFSGVSEFGNIPRSNFQPNTRNQHTFELWVGSNINPIATITDNGEAFVSLHTQRQTRELSRKGLLNELIALSKAFKATEEIYAGRERYIREQYRSFFE